MNKKMYFKIFLLTIVFSLFASTNAFGSTEGKVTGDRVNVRSGPSTSSSIIDKYNTGDKVTIASKEGPWYKITLANNQIAFIYGEFVQPDDKTAVVVTETKPEVADSTTTDLRSDLVTFAKKYVGNPYVYGGTSLTKGTDCSGFTQAVYKNFGYSINRSSYAQYNNGKAVKVSELLPGDLVFFGYNGSISHVSIYIGDGKIVHASTSSTGIIVSGLYDRGNKPFIGCRRII